MCDPRRHREGTQDGKSVAEIKQTENLTNTRKQDVLSSSPPFFQNWFLSNSIIFNKILTKFNLVKGLAPEFHSYTPQPWAHPPAMCSDLSTRVLEHLLCAQHSLRDGSRVPTMLVLDNKV